MFQGTAPTSAEGETLPEALFVLLQVYIYILYILLRLHLITGSPLCAEKLALLVSKKAWQLVVFQSQR